MLSVSITILTVLLVVVSFLIILLVLMQRPKQEGLGAAFGGGMMNDIAGAHTTDILQKGTVWLAVFFFSISILLGVLYTKQISGRDNMKVLENVKPEQPLERPLPSISEFPLPTPVEGAPTPTEGAPAETAPVPGEGGAADPEDSPKPANGEAPPAETPAPAPAPDAGKDKPSGDPPESSESKPGEPGEDKKPAESGTTPQ